MAGGLHAAARLLTALLLLAVGVGKMAAQPAEGFYRLQNVADKKYYLCPATTTYAEGQPWLTTFNTTDYIDFVWEIKKADDTYFYIINVATKQYVTQNPQSEADDANKKRVHLETSAAPDDNMKFEITANGTSFNIRPYPLIGTTRAYLNPHSGNKSNKVGDDGYKGLIGFWDATDNGSKWNILSIAETPCEAPVISVDYASMKISMTADSGSTIYYTTGSGPLSVSGTQYSAALDIIQNSYYTVRAYAVAADGSISDIATKVVDSRTSVADPSISYSGNDISITCTTENVAIYYTTDGTEPTTAFSFIDEEVYHIGASLKDLGKRWFAFTLMHDLTAEELTHKTIE